VIILILLFLLTLEFRSVYPEENNGVGLFILYSNLLENL